MTTPGFWKHGRRPISFSFIIDNFGVKFVREEHIKHPVSVLKANYIISTTWEEEKYVDITLDWDYDACEVYLSMSGYCKEALVRFVY